jgi:hypothetical protein
LFDNDADDDTQTKRPANFYLPQQQQQRQRQQI